MIEIIKAKERLLVVYVNYLHDPWVERALREKEEIRIGKVFWFKNEDITEFDLDDGVLESHVGGETPEAIFVLGEKEDGYYRIKSRILGTQHDTYLSIEMPIEQNTFLAYRDIKIFPRIDKLVSESIIIGGEHTNAIPLKEFKILLKYFPNSTETKHYADSRICMILKDYFGTMTDSQKKLENYLARKSSVMTEQIVYSAEKKNTKELYKHEVEKYKYIKKRMVEELNQEHSISEKDWQILMLQFILLIFPKYITVLENVRVKDFYSERGKTKNRYIDIALVDASGNLDVIEIKKPFRDCLLSSPYRDNYTPKKELAGAIMQAEKYIFHLNKWGIDGEKKITDEHKGKLPTGMEIQITNPKAIIIIGRSKALTKRQRFDLEVIRRKYSNIIDIITYDDLLKRLENIIEKFEAQSQP